MHTAFFFKPDDATKIERHKMNQARFAGEIGYKLGQIYPARIRVGVNPFAYLRVTGKRQEFLGQITDQDAKREGYPHIPAYKKAWKKAHGRWDSCQLVTVVDFELVSEAEYLAQRMLKKVS